MENYIVRSLIAVTFYAIANYYLDSKLTKYSGFVILIIWDAVMLLCGLVVYGYYKYNDLEITFPITWKEIVFVAAIGLVYYFADMFYMSAFHSKDKSVIVITSVIVALPLMIGVMKVIFDREYPNRGQCLGYIFVVIGILTYAYFTPNKPEIDQPDQIQISKDVELKLPHLFLYHRKFPAKYFPKISVILYESIKRKDFMINKKIFLASAIILSVVLIAPNVTWANGSYQDNNFRSSSHSRLNLFSNNSSERLTQETYSREDYKAWVNKWFSILGKTNGVVTGKSDAGLTFTHRNKTYTVNTTNAILFRAPNNDSITLSDINVGDRVVVRGTRTNEVINATEVYIVPSNFQKAQGTATVTAVNNDGTVTAQDRKGRTANLVAVENATITQSGNDDPNMSDIRVGSKVQIKGFWDSSANMFYAIKIHISK